MEDKETPNLYELPKLETSKVNFPRFFKNRFFWFFILTIFVSSFFGFLAGTISGGYFYSEIKNYLEKLNINLPNTQNYLPLTSQEEATIKVVNETSQSVVSIIVTKDLPVFEEYFYSPFEEFKKIQIPQ